MNIKPSYFWSTIFSATILLFLTVNFVWPEEPYRKQMIDGDGRGYYDYLPTLFIHKTVDFKRAFEYEKATQPLEYMGHNFHKVNDVYINKFPVGTALMILPFYLVAYIISVAVSLPADGYSILFQYAVALAALWWLWVGVFFLRKLLKSFAISETTILVVVLGMILGSNLFHYAFIDVAFSHVYSFAVITAILYSSRRVFLNQGAAWVYLSAFLFGLIVLIRPVNGLVILAVPLLADSFTDFVKRAQEVFGSFKMIPGLLLMFVMGILPQLVINYLQTGSPIVYGYQGEGFNFLRPHVVDFLFGFKKGWFVYTPVMLLLIPSFRALWKKSKFHFWSFLLFLLILVYVFSSWWNWYYGDGFGMRPMVEYEGLLALVIALWIEELKPVARKLLMAVVVILSALNLVQTYQYSKGIIDVDSMTWNAYKYVFLRTSDNYRNVVGSADETFYGHLAANPLLETLNDFGTLTPGWTPTKHQDTTVYISFPRSYPFNTKVVFSPSYRFVADSVMSSNKLYLKMELYYWEPEVDAAREGLYVVDVRDSMNELKFYKAFRIKRLPDKEVCRWRESHIGILMPRLEVGDQVKVYCWNKAVTWFNIDDFSVALYAIEPGS